MYNKSVLVFFVILLFSGIANAQTLDDYLKIAVENHPVLKANYASYQAAVEQQKSVSFLPNPMIGFGYGFSPIETRLGAQIARISVSQQIPLFGSVKSKRKTDRFRSEAEFQTYKNAVLEIQLKVKKAYVDLFQSHKHIQLWKKYITILETTEVFTKTAIENSNGKLVDVFEIDIAISEAETELQILENKYSLHVASFNILLNCEKSIPIQFPDSLSIKKEIEFSEYLNFTEHPMLQAAELQQKSAQAQISFARTMQFPKISIGFDYAFMERRPDLNFEDNGKNALMAMVSLSLPIYRKAENAAINSVKFIESQKAYNTENVKNELKIKYLQARTNLKNAHEKLKLYKHQISLVSNAIILYKADYENNNTPIENLLKQQKTLLKYQMMLEKARADIHKAEADVAFLFSAKGTK